MAGVLAWSSPAHADDPKAEAKDHLDRATQLHKEGKLAEALDELKTAYALDPQPQLLFAMGQIHVQLGQCTQAISYYQRFLATKPTSEAANVTREAIETCKTNPPPAIEATPEPKPVVPEPPPVPPSPEPRPAPLPAVTKVHTASPWYADYLGDGLVAGGVVAGVVGIVFYRGAQADRDQANSTHDYQTFSSLIDSAQSKQTDALVLGIASAALVTVGAVHIVLHRGHQDVTVVPSAGGGAVLWMGRF